MVQNFSQLPTELQLEVFKNCDAKSLVNLLRTNKEIRNSSLYTSNHLISSLLGIQDNEFSEIKEAKNLFISIFSPQNAVRKIELFETKCINSADASLNASQSSSPKRLAGITSGDEDVSLDIEEIISKLKIIQPENESSDGNDEQQQDPASVYGATKHLTKSPSLSSSNADVLSSTFKLGRIQQVKDPLAIADIAAVDSADSENRLHVIVDEDSSSIKIQFEMQLKSEENDDQMIKLFTQTERISLSSPTGYINSENDEIRINYRLIKGEEVPPRCPYSFEAFSNYYIQFESFVVNNFYLLNCVN